MYIYYSGKMNHFWGPSAKNEVKNKGYPRGFWKYPVFKKNSLDRTKIEIAFFVIFVCSRKHSVLNSLLYTFSLNFEFLIEILAAY